MKRLNNPMRVMMKAGREGQRQLTTAYNIKSGLNTAGVIAELQTITCTAATVTVKYSITIDDIKIETSAATTTSASDLALLLVDAINKEPLINGALVASAVAAVVTVTGYNPGESFAISSLSGAVLTVAVTQAAATGTQIPFGRFLISNGWEDELMVLELPAGASSTVVNKGAAGMSIIDDTLGQENQDLSGANPSRIMPFLRKGHVYMKPEVAPTSVQSPVYVRVAVDGDLDQIGGVSAAAGLNLVELTSRAAWVSVANPSDEGLYTLAVDFT